MVAPEAVGVERQSCSKCAASGPKVTLTRCPICFKTVCEACHVTRGGRLFCSQYCAEYFFFGDEE
ncbi:MAG: hypothetical protein ACE5JG_05850 [Planctomycetota bacterium]